MSGFAGVMLAHKIPAAVTETDPYFSSVVLLSSFNSTISDDRSRHTLTANVNSGSIYPTISSSQSKFGGSSVYYQNGSSRNTSPWIRIFDNTSDFQFGTGNFTVECWIYVSTTYDGTNTSNEAIFCPAANTTGSSIWVMAVNRVSGQNYWNLLDWDGSSEKKTTLNLAFNTWHHVCASRSGANLYYGANGTLQLLSSSYGSKNISDSGRPAFKNDPYGETWWSGYFDEVRITKGVARYTGSSYTVPTTAFPRS